MKNKYKFIILTLLVIAELVYLLYAISGVILFRDEPGSELFNFTAALTLHVA